MILVDIPHPHFVHFFKNLIHMLGRENVVITCQNSGIITKLLDAYGFEYFIVGKKYDGLFSKGVGQFKYLKKYLQIARKKEVSLFLGMSPALSLAARLLNKNILFFDDDDSAVQPLTKKITIPLSNLVITPACLSFENYGAKHVVYKGYQELAYLAPEYFSPDMKIIKRYQLTEHRYFIVRFNDFHAHHDIGHGGIPLQKRLNLIKLLEKYGKVYITAEGKLEKEFEPYQLKTNPEDIHHILAYARMYVGDSQTMASEAAVLGVPSFRCNTFKGKIAYLKELEEKYGLTYAFFPQEFDKMVNQIQSLLEKPDLSNEWMQKRKIMLNDMEDVNKFLLNLVNKHLKN